MIRAATAADSAVLQQIEIDAGAQFATVGLADVAAHDPFSIAELDAYGWKGGKESVRTLDSVPFTAAG